MGKYKPTIILTLTLAVFLASCKGTSTTSDPTPGPGLGPSPSTKKWVVTTFAGGGTPAQFNEPYSVAVDSSDNVYVADHSNRRIRKITKAGVISTFAYGFNNPRGVAVDSSGDVYVAEYDGHRIRKILSNRGLTTFAGNGTAGSTLAQFSSPQGMAVDAAGNIYVADTANHRIQKITSAGVVSTLAGSGEWGYKDATGTAAQFRYPKGVAVVGTNLYVADTGNHLIRKIVISTKAVTRFAGKLTNGAGTAGNADGPGLATATFDGPQGIAVVGTNLYVADTANHLIRKITTPGAVVTTFAGSGEWGYKDGTGTAAQFDNPKGVAVDSSGILYVADTINNCIREISSTGVVSTFVGGVAPGDTPGDTPAMFDRPQGIAVDSSGNVYVADTDDHRIRGIIISSQLVGGTLAGDGQGEANGTGTAASFSFPADVAVDSDGILYVADTWNHTIRRITSTGVVTTIAGSGTAGHHDATGIAAQFNYPSGVAVDSDGILYVADSGNHRIRKITSTGVVTTIAGSGTAGFADTDTDADGNPVVAQFNYPSGVAVDPSGNVYVADMNNHCIRKITPDKVVTTIAGTGARTADGADPDNAVGTLATFFLPQDVAVDSSGNVYVADKDNHRIRKIEYK